jgi:hypothetical protein
MRGDIRLAEYPRELHKVSGRNSEKAERTSAHFEWLQRELVAMHAAEARTVWEFVRRIGLCVAPILLAMFGAMTALLLQRSPRILQVGIPLVGGITLFFSTQAIAKAVCAQPFDVLTKLWVGIGVQTVPLVVGIVILLMRLNRAREPRSVLAMIPAWLKRRRPEVAGP